MLNGLWADGNPSPSDVLLLLTYERATGRFRWKSRPWERPCWNSRFEGKLAGSIDAYGYRNIGIFGSDYKAHHIVWLVETGKFPHSVIDHINGTADDNRFVNLREATQAQNCANSKRHKDGLSGLKGVSWHAQSGKWLAQIMVRGQRYYLGSFARKHDAHAAYVRAAIKFHGEFARAG